MIEAVKEDYILELKEGLSEYSSVTLIKILEHLRVNYALMDDMIYNELMTCFCEAPDLDVPIDKYFRKQQECQLLPQDSTDPITEQVMVIQLTTLLGASGLIFQAVTKFKNQPDPLDKLWEPTKAWMRKALRELKSKSKLEGSHSLSNGSG